MTSTRWSRVPWRNRPRSTNNKKELYITHKQTHKNKNVLKIKPKNRETKSKNHWNDTHLPSLECDIYVHKNNKKSDTPQYHWIRTMTIIYILYMYVCTYIRIWVCMYTCIQLKISLKLKFCTSRERARAHTHKFTETNSRVCTSINRLRHMEELSSTD
jgi:hypothetical protein